MDLVTVLGALVVGFGAGMLSGMFGVGGAVLSTPGIRALGVSPIMAVGSTIPAILPAAITGAHRYARAGLVDWRIAITCGLTGTALAIGGAKVSDLVDARWLMVATAGLLLWSGVASIRKGLAMPAPSMEAASVPVGAAAADAVVSDAPHGAAGLDADHGADHDADHGADHGAAVATADDAHDVGVRSVSFAGLAGVGATAGFVAGLLGIGGGAIMMPLFTGVLRLPVKVAVASSLVAVAIFSLPALVTHAALGHIDWPVALLLVAGTVPGARLGSHIAIGTADRQMRLLLGAFFCVIAFVYGGRELLDIF